jgi:hypothetical protein
MPQNKAAENKTTEPKSVTMLKALVTTCQARDTESTGRALSLAEQMIGYVEAVLEEKKVEWNLAGNASAHDEAGVRKQAIVDLKADLARNGFGKLDVSFHVKLWCMVQLVPESVQLGTFHHKSAMGCVRFNNADGKPVWNRIPGTDDTWEAKATKLIKACVDSIPEPDKASPGKRGKDGRKSAKWLADELKKVEDKALEALSPAVKREREETERKANVKRAQKTALFGLASLSVDEIAAALRSALVLTARPKGKEGDDNLPKPVDGVTVLRKLTAVIESLQAADAAESKRRDEEGTVPHPARKTA